MRTYKEMYGEDADGNRGQEITYLDISPQELNELVGEFVRENGYVPKTITVECDGYEFEVEVIK